MSCGSSQGRCADEEPTGLAGTMKCTIRRLLVYTVLITLISYTGFRLTTPVSFPASIPAANVGITRSEGVQAAGETRASISELKVDDTSVVSTVSTETFAPKLFLRKIFQVQETSSTFSFISFF